MNGRVVGVVSVALALVLAAVGSASAQNTSRSPKTKSQILYHGGPVMIGSQNLYLIFYGCWNATCGNPGGSDTQAILFDFVQNLGASPYFQINAGYPNESGQAPSGALVLGAFVEDPAYSRGVELTASDIGEIVADSVEGNALPPDPAGIYVVLASADVGSAATGFCTPSAPPHHGTAPAFGSLFKYAFVGNPDRCPTVAASQFFAPDGSQLPAPNGDLAADAMASALAHVLSAVVTDPNGDAWYDRYGLENADKCQGLYGVTYLTANGARANLRLGQRDYLIQQNWVNGRKGHCAMNISE